MTVGWREQLRPGMALREIVTQATASLIAMDSERLEELALCCADLNRDSIAVRADFASQQSREQMTADLKLLDQILYETRANLTVLSHLHALRIREASAIGARQIAEDVEGDLFQECYPGISLVSEESYGDN
jgi:hypothetical protein